MFGPTLLYSALAHRASWTALGRHVLSPASKRENLRKCIDKFCSCWKCVWVCVCWWSGLEWRWHSREPWTWTLSPTTRRKSSKGQWKWKTFWECTKLEQIILLDDCQELNHMKYDLLYHREIMKVLLNRYQDKLGLTQDQLSEIEVNIKLHSWYL